MEKKVIVFTSKPSLKSVKGLSSETELNGKFRNLHKEKKLYAFKDREVKAVEKIEEADIFLIKDDISQRDLERFIKEFEGELYILKHNSPVYLKSVKTSDDFMKAIFNQPPQFKFTVHIKHGMHELNGEYYPEVVTILEDENNNKFDRILKAVFTGNEKLNAALEFLHECIGEGEPEIETLNKAGFNLDAKAEGKSSLNELINKLKNGGDRIQIVKNLRDVLLEIALQEK